MKNRLELDWTLSTSDERSAFINQYLQTKMFQLKPPTASELETMGNYILWGQNDSGLNPDQTHEIQMPRRNSTWSTKNLESLDELLETPTFSENNLYKFGETVPKKTQKPLSREELRASLSPSDLKHFETLWRHIDETELTINFYEVEHGKRTKPPRQLLLSAFSEAEREKLRQRALNLSQFHYLKLKHLLVELRREQYTLKDFSLGAILPHSTSLPPAEENFASFEAEVPVFPLGLINTDLPIWEDFNTLIPTTFNETQLEAISSFYWKKKREVERLQRDCKFSFDFREVEPVYQLILGLRALEEEEQKLFATTSQLCATLRFYWRQANLPPIQEEILRQKILHTKNQDIAAAINTTYNKSYTTNYISTIFRQKIIPAINAAATYHEKIVANIFFEENFKQCTRCGRTLLLDPINFVRRTRSKDGFSNHCKQCDKEQRDLKKEQN